MRLTPCSLSLAFVSAAFTMPLAEAVPQWIWSSPQAGGKEEAEFRKAFDLAALPKKAILKISADNAAQVLINGERVLSNDNWQQPSQANIAKRLRTGRNEIVIRAKNDGGPGGVILSLSLTGEDGATSAIETDDSWTTRTQNADARPVHVLGKLGVQPWGNVFAAEAAARVVAAKDIQTLPGFTAELLYTVPKGEQGSWVSLTVDPQGRLICGDQYGGFYRLTPPPADSADPEEQTQIETLSASIGGSHGMLWAHDSLYVVVNEKAGPKSQPGLWRLRDKDGDGTFEEETLLRAFEGSGEHGPHQPVLSPDGKSLYIANGNHTRPPILEHSRAARAWGEDQLLPRQWDANGHAAGILAPGGHILKTDLDGKEMEMFCYGFRNEFAIAFNTEGELFTYDSDMEWDMGAPWYRPTRIIHCVSGADYGWRSGSGKWPDYYPDSLPALADIGPGSPTGVTFGTAAAFPAKYQAAFYAADWTYGTMYAVHLHPNGGSYKAEVEEFVSGKPLPLTSVVINPHDGAMYFAIGGRRTQSGVYRIRYTGNEAHEPLANPLPSGQRPSAEREQRLALEKLHTSPADPAVVEKAWPFLASPDRFVRYAARVAIERQPVESWIGRFRAETKLDAVIEGGIALARVGQGKDAQNAILEKLATLSHQAKPTTEQSLGLLRVLQLTFVRQGKPSSDIAATIATELDRFYPSTDDSVNRELSQVLIYLDSPRVVAKTLQLIATAREQEGAESASAALLARNEQYAKDVNAVTTYRPNRQQMALAWNLRNATVGWTPELRKQYFSWFPTTQKWRGGNSLKGFIENARKDALAKVTDEVERAALDTLSTKAEEETNLTFTPPKGPGRAYTVDDVLKFAEGRLKGRDFASGKNLFAATACLTCHRFNGEGGGLGPDITGSGNRYTLRDLLENIVDPGKVISDQYESTQLDLKDGGLMVGRILKEENGKITLAINPLVPDATVEIDAANVVSRQPYPISMMPPGLINSLNEEEVLDLLAYIQSAGNPDDKVFKK